MTAISVAVFDLGKVLVDFDYGIASRRIAALSKLPVDVDHFFATHEALLFRYEVGLMTTEQFFGEVRAVTGFTGTLEDFADAFRIFTPIQPMVDLHSALRVKKLPTYIFSNTNELAILDIGQNCPFYNQFDGHILSYEHGAMKPDAKLYEVVERMTGRRGADILYLDDRPENIATGAQRGWQAVLHETPEKTRAAVRGLGLIA